MASVGQRQMKTQVPAHRADQPEKPLVQTNEQRFQWENAVLKATKAMQHEATAVAFYLSKSWSARLKCCFPTIDTIAFDLGISKSAVSRSIRCLSDLGFIVRKKGRARTAQFDHNVYKLALQEAASIRRNKLNSQEMYMAELTIGDTAETPLAGGDLPPEISDAANSAPSEVTTGQNCPTSEGQNCPSSYTTELQSGPSGPLSDSSVSQSSDVAREADLPVQDSGALEARPDAAFRAELEPHHLTFYDQLEAIDQYRYRKVDADQRDDFAIAWDFQHGGEDDD